MITTYRVVTTSTGGNDASIRVDKSVNGTLVSSTPIMYREVHSSWRDFDGVIRIGYNVVSPLNWTCQITGDVDNHTVGENINWYYYAQQDLTLTQTTSENKFLIESGGDYYVVVNNNLSNVGSTLNAQLFNDYGMNSAPSYDTYS